MHITIHPAMFSQVRAKIWRTTPGAGGAGCHPTGSIAEVSQPSPLAAAQQQALAMRTSGDLAGARSLLETVIDNARSRLGEHHPDVLGTAQLLARMHRDADDPMAARRVLEVALEGGLRRLQENDPLILSISADLGGVAEELGNRHEARKHYLRVATEGPAVLGADHWAVQAARRYLGDAAPPPASAPPAVPPTPVAPAPIGQAAVIPPPPVVPPVVSAPPAPPVLTSPVSAPPAVPAPPVSTQPVSTPPVVSAPPSIPPPPAVPVISAPPVPPAPRTVPSPPTWNRPVPPPPVVPPPVSAPTTGDDSQTRPASRSRVVVAISAATLALAAVVGAVLVVVNVLKGPDAKQKQPDTAPTLAGNPPTDLKLTDSGATITITWTDPTSGSVPFVVAGGRAGQTLGAMGSLDPGTTRYTVHGLNPKVDYCFTVLAVYSTTAYATSGQVCTSRGTTGQPTTSPS